VEEKHSTTLSENFRPVQLRVA